MGCPYEGDVAQSSVETLVGKMFELGCYEVSLGDTIGVGTPQKTDVLLQGLVNKYDVERLAVHFHDTYDTAIENILVALKHGFLLNQV